MRLALRPFTFAHRSLRLRHALSAARSLRPRLFCSAPLCFTPASTSTFTSASASEMAAAAQLVTSSLEWSTAQQLLPPASTSASASASASAAVSEEEVAATTIHMIASDEAHSEWMRRALLYGADHTSPPSTSTSTSTSGSAVDSKQPPSASGAVVPPALQATAPSVSAALTALRTAHPSLPPVSLTTASASASAVVKGWDHTSYFQHLSTKRLGRVLLCADRVTSTQTLLNT